MSQSKGNYKHGSSGDRLYRIWTGIRYRCHNENHQAYPLYGGRGISVCEEWRNDFLKFRDWALANGYDDSLSLDRYPKQKGNYEPRNCRWATPKQQARNTKANLLRAAGGEIKSAVEWAEDPRCRVSYECLINRLRRGVDLIEAMTTPATAWKDSHRLKAQDAIDIRLKRYQGVSVSQLCKEYGVHKVTVYNILNGVTWKNV